MERSHGQDLSRADDADGHGRGARLNGQVRAAVFEQAQFGGRASAFGENQH